MAHSTGTTAFIVRAPFILSYNKNIYIQASGGLTTRDICPSALLFPGAAPPPVAPSLLSHSSTALTQEQAREATFLIAIRHN